MSDTPIPTLAPSTRRWSWTPVCCLTVILGVIGFLKIQAHMDGEIDPDDLDVPIVLVIAALLISIPATACAWLGCRPEFPGVRWYWLKQTLLLQVVGLLGSGFILWAGQWSESL